MNSVFLDYHRDFGDITTARGVYYTFGLKLNNAKSVRNHADQLNRRSINLLKNQIKFILNLQTKNESIDKYIIESFNIYNPDPLYIFVLPDGFNRTVAFRRSNFTDISFPNTTSLQTIQTVLKSSKYAHLFPSPEEMAAKQLALSDKFQTKYNQFMASEKDLNEEESFMNIVEENVRTEKNFFKFMDKLNDQVDSDEESIENSGEQTPLDSKHAPSDYQALIRHIHSKDHVGNLKLVNDQESKVIWPKNEKLSWDDFGLHGWIGKINDEHENPEENG